MLNVWPGFAVPCGTFNSNFLFSSVVTSITHPSNKSKTFMSFLAIKLSYLAPSLCLFNSYSNYKLPLVSGWPYRQVLHIVSVSPCFAPAGTSTVTVSFFLFEVDTDY